MFKPEHSFLDFINLCVHLCPSILVMSMRGGYHLQHGLYILKTSIILAVKEKIVMTHEYFINYSGYLVTKIILVCSPYQRVTYKGQTDGSRLIIIYGSWSKRSLGFEATTLDATDRQKCLVDEKTVSSCSPFTLSTCTIFSPGGGSIGESSEGSTETSRGQSLEAAGGCAGGEAGGLRASKSDTSLTDSFVVLAAPEPVEAPAPARPPAKPVLDQDAGVYTYS